MEESKYNRKMKYDAFCGCLLVEAKGPELNITTWLSETSMKLYYLTSYVTNFGH